MIESIKKNVYWYDRSSEPIMSEPLDFHTAGELSKESMHAYIHVADLDFDGTSAIYCHFSFKGIQLQICCLAWNHCFVAPSFSCWTNGYTFDFRILKYSSLFRRVVRRRILLSNKNMAAWVIIAKLHLKTARLLKCPLDMVEGWWFGLLSSQETLAPKFPLNYVRAQLCPAGTVSEHRKSVLLQYGFRTIPLYPIVQSMVQFTFIYI